MSKAKKKVKVEKHIIYSMFILFFKHIKMQLKAATT